MCLSLIVSLLLAATGAGKFEGVWKGELPGKPYAVLTILSDHPPRGTLAQGDAVNLYIQDPRIVKGVLRFKTIDPNDGLVNYELKVTSPTEATLTIAGRQPVPLRRN